MKTIFRTNPQRDFTILANAMLRDAALSFKARGILAMVLTHSAEWEVHSAWISKHGTEGREAIASGMSELEQAGYVRFDEVREKGTGKIEAAAWTFSDTPFPPAARTNKTRWRTKPGEAATPAEPAQTPESHNTGSRLTASPLNGKPAAKKEQATEDESARKPSENKGAAEKTESPDDPMGWREIGLALLAVFARPAIDIERLGCDEAHYLTAVDKLCTRGELRCLCKFIVKPHDRNNPLLVSRATKLRTLLPNFREQIGLAVQCCPPPKQRTGQPAAAVEVLPEPTPEEIAAAKVGREKAMREFRDKMRGAGGNVATTEAVGAAGDGR